MKKIIDCHTHIYPDKIADRASEAVGDFYDLPMKFSGTVSVLKEQCAKNCISKCLVCSVAQTPKQVHSVNVFIAESVRESAGLFFGFCTLHPDMSRAEIRAELAFAKEAGLLGIKLHPDFQRFEIDEKRAYTIYEEGGGFVFLFHTGDTRFSYSDPARLAKVLRDFPALTAIGAHFGGWSDWENGRSALADSGTRYENLYVDLSSSFYAMSPEKAISTIHAFGADRILFGSDFPMWDAYKEYEFLCELNIAEEEKDCILYKNAERLFGDVLCL